MRLKEFKQRKVGELVRYTAPLSDDRGESAYQLLIVGTPARVKKTFGKSNFEVTISPEAGQEDWIAGAEKRLGLTEQVLPPDAFDDLEGLFSPGPKPTAKSSVVCAIRREKPGGTGFALFVPLVVPAGLSVFFMFPPAFFCIGTVLPVAGNLNLFLNANSFIGPTIAASTLGGTAADTVRFTTSPFAQFFPIFRVFGAASSVGTFAAASFGLP